MEANKQTAPTTKEKRFDLYQHVTNIIIKQLEAGNIPWQKPWIGGDSNPMRLPMNSKTNNTYQGINVVLLWSAAMEKEYNSNVWATVKQWNDQNETVKADESKNGAMVLYWDTREVEEDGEIKKKPFMKYSRVFNRCQLESYKPEENVTPVITPLFERLDHVEIFVANTKAVIKHQGYKAAYNHGRDEIKMPRAELFIDTDSSTAKENYYSTLGHELVHWTGHPSRLDRKYGKRFGDLPYASEELVAELGAAFFCAELEITNAPKPDHASYLASWLGILKENKYALIGSAATASKAIEYMCQLQPQQ